jgi:hypothetical protein
MFVHKVVCTQFQAELANFLLPRSTAGPAEVSGCLMIDQRPTDLVQMHSRLSTKPANIATIVGSPTDNAIRRESRTPSLLRYPVYSRTPT